MSIEIQAGDPSTPKVPANLSLRDGEGQFPTPLTELSRHTESDPEDLLACLRRIKNAVEDSFPENIFLDLDRVANHLSKLPSPERNESTALIVQLQRDYGGEGPIRFRYVHDFLYGFDWAKWVRRDPHKRCHIGPYDRSFLRYLEKRGRELVALIENDDKKYPKLPDGTPRNPFGFSREPADEAALYRALASKGWIPVPAWSLDSDLSVEIDFEERRRATAAELQGHRDTCDVRGRGL